MNRAVRLAALIGLAAYAVPPWYYVEDLSLFSLDWAKGYPFGKAGSALALGTRLSRDLLSFWLSDGALAVRRRLGVL